jgi:hypothetical protein
MDTVMMVIQGDDLSGGVKHINTNTGLIQDASDIVSITDPRDRII